MIHFIATLFSWPNGIVVGNLIASALWALPAFITHHLLIRRHITNTLASHLAARKQP